MNGGGGPIVFRPGLLWSSEGKLHLHPMFNPPAALQAWPDYPKDCCAASIRTSAGVLRKVQRSPSTTPHDRSLG